MKLVMIKNGTCRKLVSGIVLALSLGSSYALASPTDLAACLAALGGSKTLASHEIETDLFSVPIKIRGRRKRLETQVYIAKPAKIDSKTPMVIMNPGLSKAYFKEQADQMAKLGYIAVSYNHLNVGEPVVGPLNKPTVDEDAELAQQVYNQLPKYTQGRRIVMVPHSRGALVGAALSHLLLAQGEKVVGMIAFQPYIYWRLEHMMNEFSSSLAENILVYLQSLLPVLTRILTPLYASHYDSVAQQTALHLANGVRDLVFASLVVAQNRLDRTSDNLSIPRTLKLALRQVLPQASTNEINNILEKLKGMEPTPGHDAEFLGQRLIGLKIPIHIVSAEVDDLSTESMAAGLAEFASENGLENLTFVTLEGEGHYFPYDKPKEMANIINAFSPVPASRW